jgi:hypothetical protein
MFPTVKISNAPLACRRTLNCVCKNAWFKSNFNLKEFERIICHTCIDLGSRPTIYAHLTRIRGLLFRGPIC